jgi:hypothetical protein
MLFPSNLNTPLIMKKWSLKLKYPNSLQIILSPRAKSGLTISYDTKFRRIAPPVENRKVI